MKFKINTKLLIIIPVFLSSVFLYSNLIYNFFSFSLSSPEEIEKSDLNNTLEKNKVNYYDFDESLAINKNIVKSSYYNSFSNTQEILDSEKPPATILAFNASDFGNVLRYPENMNENCGPIKYVTYQDRDNSMFFDLEFGQVFNCTDISNEILIKESEKNSGIKIIGDGKIEVLIMHTHTTESFEPYERNFYDESYSSHTTEECKNITSVGEIIVKELSNAGIGVIHDKTVNDFPSYSNAYKSSRMRVEEILEEYPDIKIVLDIHRDAIINEGTRIAPFVEVDGKKAAQIMIISCCDDDGTNPNFIKNFHFACGLQNKIEENYNNLTRPILFDYRHYNQDLSTGSLLIEVGSHANSLEQALYSGELFGKSLVEYLLSPS